VPHVPGVSHRLHDPGQRTAAEVRLQERHLGVGHVRLAEVQPVQDRFEGLDVVVLGADGEPPDRPVRVGVGVVQLSHAGAHRVGLVSVFRAGRLGRSQGGEGLGEFDEPAGLVGFPRVADLQRRFLAMDDLGEGAVRVRGDRAVGPARQDLDDRAGGRAGLVALPGRQGTAGDLAERGAELLLQVSGGCDAEVAGAAHPAGLERAEDVLGVGVEEGVDERSQVAAGQGQRPGLLPGFRVGTGALAVGEPPADDDVGDHGRAGHPLVRGRRQADHADQVHFAGQGAAEAGVLLVGGVAAGDERAQAPGRYPGHAPQDRVVVQGEPGSGVEHLIRPLHVAERDVAREPVGGVARDAHRVGGLVADPGEPRAEHRADQDLRLGVQQLGDQRRRRVKLDAGDADATGSERGELPRADPRFDDYPLLQAQVPQRPVHRAHQHRVRVVRVQDGHRDRAEQPLARLGAAAEPGQDRAQPLPVAQVVAAGTGGEHAVGGAPSAVAAHLVLRFGGQRGAADHDVGGDLKRVEVGLNARPGARGGKLADPGRLEARPVVGEGRPGESRC